MGRVRWRFSVFLYGISKRLGGRSSGDASPSLRLRWWGWSEFAGDRRRSLFVKLSKNCFALLVLGGVVACNTKSSHSDGALGEGQGVSRENDSTISVFIPKLEKYEDNLRIRVALPKQYIWAAGSDEARRGSTFKPIDYHTLEPVDVHEPGAVGVTTYRVFPRYRVGDSGIMQSYERYPDIGETRFGLSYRPDPVPGRPEALWKRNFLKPGVSGEEFYIGCTPPIGPGSMIEPTDCGMTMMFHPTEVNGRPAGIMVNASVPASKIEDWETIEAAIRNLVEPNVEWVGGDK